MRWQEFPIVGGAYKDDTRPWSCQDTVNYMPVMAERPGGRSPSLLRGVPGLVALAQLENAPVRGLHNAEGLLLAVVGNSLYRIAGDGGATNIGTIPGVGRVSMAHNQITYGNQVAIATGSTGYVYDTTNDQLSPITDEAFPGAISFDFIDGYITGIEPGRRFAFFSDLADAFSYNALDRLQAESSPDRLVGQIISHREWWLFGERTVELYQNTGAATGTFQRAEGVVIEVGCASGATIANLDNSVFWLGNDGVVYRANGYTPQRVSTHAIEQDISRCNTAQSFAFTWVDRGHSVYYLTFPDGHTWGYDVAANEWHRRQSEKLDRWRINDVVRWNNQWVAGDYTNGNLYTMDWVAQHENGAILERRRTAGVLHDSQNAVVTNGLEIVVDTGQPGLGHLEIHGALGNGYVGDAVDFRYTASGGIPGYSFRIAGGSLPDGLTMDAEGHVTGEYATAGDYSWTVEATDAMGSVATLDDGVVIIEPEHDLAVISVEGDKFYLATPYLVKYDAVMSGSRGFCLFGDKKICFKDYDNQTFRFFEFDESGIFAENNISVPAVDMDGGFDVTDDGKYIITCATPGNSNTDYAVSAIMYSESSDNFSVIESFESHSNHLDEKRAVISPDNSLVAMSASPSEREGPSGVSIWAIGGGSATKIFEHTDAQTLSMSVTSIVWRPDSKKVIFMAASYDLIVDLSDMDNITFDSGSWFDFEAFHTNVNCQQAAWPGTKENYDDYIYLATNGIKLYDVGSIPPSEVYKFNEGSLYSSVSLNNYADKTPDTNYSLMCASKWPTGSDVFSIEGGLWEVYASEPSSIGSAVFPFAKRPA